jgi:hypothetical protein
LKEASKEGITVCEPVGKHHIGTSVINNRQLANERYDAKLFYARNKALQHLEPTEPEQKVPQWSRYKYCVAYWGRRFVDETPSDDGLVREHDERQPYIQQDIMDALINDHSCHSYRALSN